MSNLPTFEDNFLLKLVLKGVPNSNQQTDVHMPISLDILQKMMLALPMVVSSPYKVSLYAAVLSEGFFGLMHLSEMVLSEHALVATNMYISSTKVVCLLPMSPFPSQFTSISNLRWDLQKGDSSLSKSMAIILTGEI